MKRQAADERSLIHGWVSYHHPKTGVCENCGAEGATEYAFLWHPAPHTRNREDYEELCHSCHVAADREERGIRDYLRVWFWRRR